jgi:hypothetical protein
LSAVGRHSIGTGIAHEQAQPQHDVTANNRDHFPT